ncbi:hypothetical protein SKAU_G00430590 [Synaphobranchus kaupii]|uniref:G-protein coupled receptors family 1 profile domain-containing protein n=1 Tax=Synaphobranchus kaupii TaxID=118154 RepID=A0A9Q1E491_SYNKA|nr:hypothetical protein SKAU_G00430590 [Synaphobranchus kaupii]
MEALNSTVGYRGSEGLVLFTVLYILAFLVGLVGSLTALWAFTCSHGKRRTVDIYLINLLVSDLLLTLALPFKIATGLGVASWGLRIFHCQVSAVVVYINLYVSIVFLALVSADRYLQISQSPRLRCAREAGLARVMSVVVWALVLVIMVPNMLIPHSGRGCGGAAAAGAVVPATGTAAGWTDVSSPAAPPVTSPAVTLAYVVCFVPYHAVRTPYTLAQGRPITDFPLWGRLYLAKESTLLLAILHVCFNPFLYFHLSRSFRQRLMEAFRPKGNSSVPTLDLELSPQPCPPPPPEALRGPWKPCEPHWRNAGSMEQGSATDKLPNLGQRHIRTMYLRRW